MDDEVLIVSDVELALADADWRQELARMLGRPVVDDELIPVPFRGEAETALRRAFEERQRAFRAWRAARGLF